MAPGSMDDAAEPALPPAYPGASRFDRLLRRLDADRDLAGEKYERLRRKLIRFFEWNGCSPAEDLVDETLDRLSDKVASGEVLDVGALAWGVAKRIRQEAHRKANRLVPVERVPGGYDAIPDRSDLERDLQARLEEERHLACLQSCLERLPAGDRSLFLDYHGRWADPARHREELATQAGMTIGALRVKINRVREKLERCVRACAGVRSHGPHASR